LVWIDPWLCWFVVLHGGFHGGADTRSFMMCSWWILCYFYGDSCDGWWWLLVMVTGGLCGG